ncbi:MAG: alpha/beta hydrolase [Mycobacteriales bacterium]
MDLATADGVRLHAVHLPVPDASTDACVVLAHGFTNSTAAASVRRVAHELSQRVGVLAYDARGHGRSGGHSTLGDREPLDVDAAVAAARRLGYRRVVTCGWSMGGSNVLRHAALRGRDVAGHLVRHVPDAVVSVSAVSRWYYRDTPAMRRVHFVIERRSGRAIARVARRTRISPTPWDPVPLSPVECVPLIAPIPLLLVHGDQDSYFPVDHPQALHAASNGAAQLWLERGMGHAEKAATSDLLARLAAHVTELAPQDEVAT